MTKAQTIWSELLSGAPYEKQFSGGNEMIYIIMCGSNHEKINGIPRQLVEIKGERILDRTIRLLRENGVKDIGITCTDNAFHDVDAEIIHYDSSGPWINAFVKTYEPTTYILGDVYFSPEAIRKIVETDTNDIEFFASAPPFATGYSKPWAEPFAFKVVNHKHFHDSIAKVKELSRQGAWHRDPISWELWQVIKGTPINQICYTNYTVINDYTCDIDEPSDIRTMERMV